MATTNIGITGKTLEGDYAYRHVYGEYSDSNSEVLVNVVVDGKLRERYVWQRLLWGNGYEIKHEYVVIDGIKYELDPTYMKCWRIAEDLIKNHERLFVTALEYYALEGRNEYCTGYWCACRDNIAEWYAGQDFGGAEVEAMMHYAYIGMYDGEWEA